VATLLLLATLTLIVTGLLGLAMRERRITSAHEAIAQADLAIQAGLAQAVTRLDHSLRDETGIIFAVAVPAAEEPLPLLLTANYDPATRQWQYQPLVSGYREAAPSNRLQRPERAADGGEWPALQRQPTDEETRALARHFDVTPGRKPPLLGWEILSLPEGESEKVFARYCFHLEDLQGRLNLGHAGNLDGPNDGHVRAVPSPHAVPGLNLTRAGTLDQADLFTLLDPAAGDAPDLGRQLLRQRQLLLSPDLWKEVLLQPCDDWPGRDPATVLARDQHGRLRDPVWRAIEEQTCHRLAAYEERALIPPDPAFRNLATTAPKLNLNRLLGDLERAPAATRPGLAQQAVAEIAEHIRRHLPDFARRRGGYCLGSSEAERDFNYLQCLAAGILDYADSDPYPILIEGVCRGTDAHPFVSEQWQRYRFERTYTEDGDRFIEFSITHYLELWNLCQLPVRGRVQAAFECRGHITAGAGIYPVHDLLSGTLTDGHVCSGQPIAEDGVWWHDSRPVDLAPGAFVVVGFEPVVFKLRSGPASLLTRSADYTGPDDGNDRQSRYRLRFGQGDDPPVLVDLPHHPLDRPAWYGLDTGSRRQRFNTTLPGMSHSEGFGSGRYADNLGDPRAAFFIDHPQDQVNYENGSSPGSRNLRYNVAANAFHRECLPHLWPDGGHSCSARSERLGRLDLNPDDLAPMPAEPHTHVQHLSNQGRLFSLSELGHVFDPMQWDANGGGEFNTPSYQAAADLTGAAKPSSKFCGGHSLRIGRPEHRRFRPAYHGSSSDQPPDRRFCATALLDLFHCGQPFSDDSARREGNFIRIDGQLNLNTASRDSLRALAAGHLVMDPRSTPPRIDPATQDKPADRIADAILSQRPFLSAAELPERLLDDSGEPLLGRSWRSGERDVQPEWNDAAAEEVFARLFNSVTVRSRHFRIVITGQCCRLSRNGELRVLATRSRSCDVFLEPVRAADGSILRHEIHLTRSRQL
jgi:hypothetical protein